MSATAYEQTSWYAQAECRGHAALFFTDEYGARPARAICEVCPVRVECLEYALDQKIEDGVWGGMTGLQRKRERTARRKRAGAA